MDIDYQNAILLQMIAERQSEKQSILTNFDLQLANLKQKINSQIASIQLNSEPTYKQQQIDINQNEQQIEQPFLVNAQPPYLQSELQEQQFAQQIDVNNDVQQQQNGDEIDFQELIEFNIEGKSKYTQLSKTQSQQIPIVINLLTKVPDNQLKRPPIDLICVIDVSASMEGDKIHLVRETLKFMLNELDNQDRLSLIKFDNQSEILCDLLEVIPENQQTFMSCISQLQSRGGTNIASGIGEAVEIIHRREKAAAVTGIFLLSDGQDWGALQQVQSNQQFQNNVSSFVLHTFGFGADHDPNLMRDLSKFTNGSFYYISELNLVEECFLDASTGLSSVIAKNVKLSVECIPSLPQLNDTRISKCYGNWVYNSDLNAYELNVNQLLCGATKNYVIEVNLPPVKRGLPRRGKQNQEELQELQEIYDDGEDQQEIAIVQATLIADSVKNNNQQFKKTIKFGQIFIAEDEEFKFNAEELKQNEKVIINHLRVKAAESLQTAQQQADSYNFSDAQKILTEILQQIKESGLQDTSIHLQVLVKDIQQSLNNCNMDNYAGTRTMMIARQYQHMNQQSQPMDGVNLDEQTLYANHFQTITRTIRAQPQDQKNQK